MSSFSRSGNSSSTCSRDKPAASKSSTSMTRMRIPLMQGRPPHCSGLTVIRSVQFMTYVRFVISYGCRTNDRSEEMLPRLHNDQTHLTRTWENACSDLDPLNNIVRRSVYRSYRHFCLAKTDRSALAIRERQEPGFRCSSVLCTPFDLALAKDKRVYVRSLLPSIHAISAEGYCSRSRLENDHASRAPSTSWF